MNNEHDEVDIINNEDTGSEVETQVEAEEQVDWKAKYEAEEGRRKRLETKLAKSTEKHEDTPRKSEELDYGAKAFLVANGVKGVDETKLVKEIMANTGKSLDSVLESKYFQAELKELRDLRMAAEATPNGAKRSSQSASSTVEYWLAKGELPPASERELRTKVVNARIQKESKSNVFYK